jgi:hypothetical protein
MFGDGAFNDFEIAIDSDRIPMAKNRKIMVDIQHIREMGETPGLAGLLIQDIAPTAQVFGQTTRFHSCGAQRVDNQDS